MSPDYDRAAVAAMQMLIEYEIMETPIDPINFLLKHPHVRVLSFANMANSANIEREELVPLFVANQDAATFKLKTPIEDVQYVVVYNMRLPFEIICRAVARELGHIVMGHDGLTRPYDVRRAEAMCFAHHLLSPRPVFQLLKEAGIPLTMNVLSDTTGCIDECVYDLQAIPGAHVPKEINNHVKELFRREISEYIRFHNAINKQDHSPLVDLGTFMDNYEE